MGDVQEAVDLVPALRVDRGRPDAAAPGRGLDLVEATAPELIAALGPVSRPLRSSQEAVAAEAVYAELPSINFSRSVLAHAPDRFVTMPVSGLAGGRASFRARSWRGVSQPQPRGSAAPPGVGAPLHARPTSTPGSAERVNLA